MSFSGSTYWKYLQYLKSRKPEKDPIYRKYELCFDDKHSKLSGPYLLRASGADFRFVSGHICDRRAYGGNVAQLARICIGVEI